MFGQSQSAQVFFLQTCNKFKRGATLSFLKGDAMKYTKIKYVPTGVVFNLPTVDAEKIFKTDRENFEIVDGEIIPETTQPQVETSTFAKVVVDQKDKKETKKDKKETKK